MNRLARALAAALLAVAAALALPPAAQAQPGPIVDVPVSFDVLNVNRTGSGCTADGRPYTVHGFLTAPAELLARPNPDVTVYLHGTNTAQWIWRLDVPGHNYVAELAARGHASVTVDRIGFGSVPLADGFGTCTGANADVAHQIVQQLRAGSYRVEGGVDGGTPTAFGPVYLGGHSSGALLAELVAESFGDVDGVLAAGWAGIGITAETTRRFLPGFEDCQQQLYRRAIGFADETTTGYTWFDRTQADFEAAGLGAQAPTAVRAAVAARHARTPCGVLVSEPMAIMEDLTALGRIDVPVHFVFGGADVLRDGVEPYPGLLTASPQVTVQTVAQAGHLMVIDDGAAQVHDGVARWLDDRRADRR
jgi:alpha-beta hydrolase superfamily lysophospholipase